MLIYLSSYPRSGNTWVRILIRHYFDRRSSSIYREETGDPNLEQNEDGSYGSAFSEYQAQYPPIVTRKRLVNGCAPILSEEFRQHLGALDEYFFLKTHETPFEKYFDGEYVIHLIRHPGAVFWSYYNFMRDNESEAASNLTIEEVIKGQVPFGSWCTYNERWLECGKMLGDRFLLYSYEQLSAGEGEFCKKVSSLTHLPILREFGSFPEFEHWHHFAPKLFRSGRANEWQSHLSWLQLGLIKLFHGPTMDKLGYQLSKQQSESLEVDQAMLLEMVRQQNDLIIHLQAEVDRCRETSKDQARRLNELETERDWAMQTLQSISRTRIYKFMRHLGRWQWVELPGQTDPTDTP